MEKYRFSKHDKSRREKIMKFKLQGRYLYYLAGLLFWIGAAAGKEIVFLLIGLCFFVLGLPPKNRKEEQEKDR